jgi:general secretion pathway protein A
MQNKIKNFFGFKKIPFSKSIGVNELFQSAELKEACARLELALQNEDMALLTGAAGSGKSSAIRAFADSLDPAQHKIVYIPADNFKIGEIAKLALAELQVKSPYQATAALRALKKAVATLSNDKGIKPVIIIDESQELPLTTLSAFKHLLNFSMDSSNLLFILLCGQSEFQDTIQLLPLESLKRRMRIRCHMSGLTLDETSRYISHQLKISGIDKNIFTDDTISQIYSMSKGIISNINRFCFDLIIYAVSQSKDIIEPSMLERIAH